MTTSREKKQEIIDAFHFRHATKSFDSSKKIADSDFDFILETGRLSPSSVGYEPWKFLVVQSPELRAKLKEVSSGARGQLDTASHFVVILAHKNARYDSDYVYNIHKNVKQIPEEMIQDILPRYKAFQDDSQNLFESERSLFDWASKQTYIALANMMTSAAQIGIDSCPIEGYLPEAVNNILADEGIVDTDTWNVSVMAAFGYRETEPAREKTRQPLNDIVKWV
ncbi:NAD(P)H-dependent oxidoreductase [Alkalicoccobacillus gibsonii]|uniref:NAD(P)H-dependent oxidoreductase n=1 Tax=Alkalicoccobacillus gibsonii TaxID=79881 RepID=UPI0019336E05|nr:NAD(P)H-dependent oxidoreductase [Alkalicoccobacillus gibsonii]MBM0066912.1 NAD(P)H-dependent oxidoreductase [Alkalicoccobacillus gibsonii]